MKIYIVFIIIYFLYYGIGLNVNVFYKCIYETPLEDILENKVDTRKLRLIY